MYIYPILTFKSSILAGLTVYLSTLPANSIESAAAPYSKDYLRYVIPSSGNEPTTFIVLAKPIQFYQSMELTDILPSSTADPTNNKIGKGVE